MNHNQNENEIWKDIPGFEGAYQISNMGRVRSLDRFMNMRFTPGQMIKTFPMQRTGYYVFNVWDRIHKTLLVGRLVGLLFVEKPDGWDESWHITYINRDKSDNRADNLKWRQGTPMPKIKVVQLTKAGDFVAEYDSINAASKATGLFLSNIYAVADPKCKGNKSCGGYVWVRADDYYRK